MTDPQSAALTPPATQSIEPIDVARFIVNVVEDKKAENILLLDMRPDVMIADFIIICTGTGDRQLRALTEHVRDAMKEHYHKLPSSVEGTPESGWMLMDYGGVIVHLFQEAQRRYYDLEGLWRKAHVLVRIQ
jgi:ribosome-associated protein